MGLYKKDLSSGELKLLFKKDIHDISIRADSTIVISDNKALFASADFGKTWEKVEVKLNVQLETQPAITDYNRKIPLHKLIMDLHTGKAFFGKAYEAIWIVLVGLSITLLSLTGFLMWFKRKRQMRKKRKQISS
ncbi:MAG: PepSY domain-containing protein [Bacteroidales bacterium]|nr:PepSY domain-containing protein [Bacteroidales bacterium]